MTYARWGVASAVAVVALFLVMPQERLDGLTEGWRRTTGHTGQACLDHERRQLKDPDSARLLAGPVAQDSKITINYKAKNSYGAFEQLTAVCAIDDGGRVSDSGTSEMRRKADHDAIIKGLDDEYACLTKLGDLMEKRRMSKQQAERELGGPCHKR